MNFIISILLVLFLVASLPVKGSNRRQVVPNTCSPLRRSRSHLRRERQPWNLPDGTMRVINGRPIMSISIFSTMRSTTANTPITRIPTCNPASNCLTYIPHLCARELRQRFGAFDRRAASGPHGYRLFCGPISDRRSGVCRHQRGVCRFAGALIPGITPDKALLQDYFHSFHLVVTLLGRLYRVDDPLQSSAALLPVDRQPLAFDSRAVRLSRTKS